VNTPDQERIFVLDFGSQYIQLIARRVREQNVFCQIVRHDIPAEQLRALQPKGLIFSGGPNSVYDRGAPRCDPAILELGVPVLGICYGMQLGCQLLGGKVGAAVSREYGRAHCRRVGESRLFDGAADPMQVWMSHGDQVEDLSGDFRTLATTDTCPVAAVEHTSQPFYGLQFHPEVTHTPEGGRILANFVRDICGCAGRWTMENFVTQAAADIREQVGKARVICGLSGGVDSSVTAALVARAVGPQLSCIFVDNGLLRSNEAEQVVQTFSEHFDIDLHVVDAADRFLGALAGVEEPQQKRKIIGHQFIDVFKDQAVRIEKAHFLAQGTLYPDVIESGSDPLAPAATIKTHHNVGGLPEDLGFELVEPLRDLFKDEVRRLGTQLGLPDHIVWRHPFPGPGLAVRCLGPVSEDRLDTLRKADAIIIEEIRRAGLYESIGQAFGVLLPVSSVGVMGDDRTYEDVLAVRAVETDDFMTADWVHLPYDLLGRISNRIINEVAGVNRVTYDISSKPPATIEWE